MTIRKSKVTLMTIAAMMTALTTLATMFFKIPIGLGYIHLGDAFVILAALMLPRKYACFAAGIGAAIADIIGGFAIWAPWTLAAKAIAVLLITSIAFPERKLHSNSTSGNSNNDIRILSGRTISAFAVAAIWSAAIYYIAEGVIYGNWQVPLAGIPFNLFQVVVGAVIASALKKPFKRFI